MTLKSFEELEFLLNDEERKAFYGWKECKDVLAQRPNYMMTQQRIMPYLPMWMKKNVIDARELFDCNNTSYGTRLLWNHVLTLTLGKTHEVTFAILDDKYCLDRMKQVLQKVAETYSDLCRLYKAYGHPMTLVSMQTDDFGMLLPPTFYDDTLNDIEMTVGTRDEAHLTISINEMIEGLAQRPMSMMDFVEMRKEYINHADKENAPHFNAWYEEHRTKLLNHTEKVCKLLGKTGHKYYVAPMWNCIDIYMGECRYWGRELCVKIDLEEDVHHVEDLNRVRPMIDNIIKKTAAEDFAFGVKKINAEVQTCDRVAAENSYAKAI